MKRRKAQYESDTGKRLRREAKTAGRLADIADALKPVLGEVEFSPLSEWVIRGRCEMCGCQEEAGWCYCCNPVEGYGDDWQEKRHPNGVDQKKAGSLGHPPIPLNEYVRSIA